MVLSFEQSSVVAAENASAHCTFSVQRAAWTGGNQAFRCSSHRYSLMITVLQNQATINAYRPPPVRARTSPISFHDCNQRPSAYVSHVWLTRLDPFPGPA